MTEQQLVPKLPRRKKQPTAAQMRATIARSADEMMRLQGELNEAVSECTRMKERIIQLANVNTALRAEISILRAPQPWWDRILGRRPEIQVMPAFPQMPAKERHE